MSRRISSRRTRIKETGVILSNLRTMYTGVRKTARTCSDSLTQVTTAAREESEKVSLGSFQAVMLIAYTVSPGKPSKSRKLSS